MPDVTNVQVVVLTEAAGLSAEEMERFVTFPVEMGLNGLPDLAGAVQGGPAAGDLVARVVKYGRP